MIHSRRHRRSFEIRRAGIHPKFGTNLPKVDMNSTGKYYYNNINSIFTGRLGSSVGNLATFWNVGA